MRSFQPVIAALTVVALLLSACGRPAHGLSSSATTPANGSVSAVAHMPPRAVLPFEQNVGQWSTGPAYVARAGALTAFYSDSSVMFSLLAPSAHPSAAGWAFDAPPDASRPVTEHGWAIRQSWVGATAAPPTAEEPSPASISYFRGGENRWLPSVPTFQRLRYADAWPGVDVVVDRDERGALKSTYLLAARVDPALIRMGWEGAPARLDEDGALVFHLPFGTLRESPPIAWQDTEAGRVGVPVRFEILSEADADPVEVGFRVGDFDQTRPLVIDPSIDFCTFLGGGTPAISASDTIRAVAIDSTGAIYAAGDTYSTDFPVTPGAFDTTYAGGVVLLSDAFVSKLSSDGRTLVYSTYLGGTNAPSPTGDDIVYTMNVDSAGAAYVGGFSISTNFPTTVGAFQPGGQAFATKLRPDGAALLYSARFGGAAGQTSIGGSALDSSGNFILAGFTSSSDFQTTGGAYQTVPPVPGQRDAFVLKLNPAGSAPTFSTLLGGTGPDVGSSVVLATDGSYFVAGGTESANFPTTGGAFRTTLSGTSDGFVTHLNAAGSALVASTYLGGSGTDGLNVFALGSDGHVFLTGSTASADFPTTAGAFDRTRPGGNDGVVVKIRSDLQSLIFSTFLGGAGEDSLLGAGVDGAGAVYIVGTTDSTDFPLSADALDSTFGGARDGVVSKLSSDGSTLLYGSFLGAADDDAISAAVLVSTDRLLLGGLTRSPAFPTTAGAFDTTYNAYYDGFLVLYSVIAAQGGGGQGPTPGTVNQRSDDDKDDRPKPTEEQRQQRQHSNRGNRDDVYTEGNVVEVHQDERPPYVMIGNRDGLVKLVLLCGADCPTIRVGDYVEADGEKQHEQLFEATDVTVSKR